MKIAIQGEAGSFHELAAHRWFGTSIDLICCPTFGGVFAAMQNNQADAAVVAVENSLYGSINEVYDLLQKFSFPIIGEIPERIHQNLITLSGTDPKDITQVFSHPVALAQCSEFLDKNLPRAERIELHDTAAAVEHIKDMGNPGYAAIASSSAAALHGLPILQAAIEDQTTNFTRFLVLQKNPTHIQTANKASLILQTNHQPGALYRVLGVFADANVNIVKLQSRPIIGKVWKYQFYLDVQTAGRPLQNFISEITSQGCEITILGEYLAAPTTLED